MPSVNPSRKPPVALGSGAGVLGVGDVFFPRRRGGGVVGGYVYRGSVASLRDQYVFADKSGLVFSGMSPDGMLPEIVERPDHPWFVGVQFHPELKSKPFDPHPLFASFIEAAVKQSRLV